MRRRTTASAVVIALGVTAASALPSVADTPTELLLSEYIEGSSFNKAVEIYNGTGEAVDLEPYVLTQYSNGNTSASVNLDLTGTLAAGDVFVVAHSSADPAILAEADLTSGAGLFNGDDALVLFRDEAVVDSFGQVGVDPGSQWPGGGADDTLRRLPAVCAGDTDPFDAFDAAEEWEVLPVNTFDGLGAHTTTCDGGPVEDAAPAVASTTPADGALGVSPSASLEVEFTEPVVADGAFALECTESGALALAADGGPTTFTLTPEAELAEGEECTLTVTASAVTDVDEIDPPDAMEEDVAVTFTVSDGPVTISTIQGEGDTSPLDGQTVTFEGVVVGDYEGASPNLRGFYVQSRDEDADDNPATSEGIFVFNAGADEVGLGDVVSITGEVSEYQGQTQVSFADVEVLDTGASVTPASVSLPFADAAEAERYEGMAVEFDQELYVTEFYLLGRFGEITVSSGDRLDQPTTVAEPGADANAVQAANDLNRIKIDDTLNNQNPDPIIFGGGGDPLTADNPLRGGDSVTGLTGVMTYTWAGNSASGNAWRVRPASPTADTPVFESNTPRPASAPEVGGSIKVASFNVLNYFTTIDGSGPICGPVGSEQFCRGADSELELERQTEKLVDAMLELDADVIGIMEMENTPGVEPLAYLSDALNAEVGAGTYSYVDSGAIGTDVIRVGFLYNTTTVSEAGDIAVLDSSVDPRFDDDNNRPALAQTFEETATGETFTAVSNHWKSKGCGSATGANADLGDGASCWNETRTLAAEAIVDWVATSPTGVEDPDVFILGDLNSYAQEDPIDVLRDAGYVDMAAEGYGYVFDGQWGSLDYVFASSSLAEQVTGSAHVNINADEPSVLDYNTDFKSEAQIESLYAPDWYRTSDHDPVLVGLDLDSGPAPTPICEISYTIHGQWPHGFNTQVWVKNIGDEPIKGWDVEWTFAGDEQVSHLWSGQVTQSGADVSVESMPWNGTIKPGKRTTFGFIGSTGTGALDVDEFTLNGLPCAVAP
ncbi:ExeM/NucH family extracellular endonuclease [Demequina muriae]|uniref:ExeM/NucH family extracellular endonuclease n=1 Tax=Demequina muriae TaxID=3051664 RepID=A0ABT8GI89_9MICO|nr:ExeM/NucH family extracellular endonuclease [Demequina sp. EGI L300058]MDN4481148.1 ExeM/NucH family extracellular endonuclease [Demequina sp. EGI L300058]